MLKSNLLFISKNQKRLLWAICLSIALHSIIIAYNLFVTRHTANISLAGYPTRLEGRLTPPQRTKEEREEVPLALEEAIPKHVETKPNTVKEEIKIEQKKQERKPIKKSPTETSIPESFHQEKNTEAQTIGSTEYISGSELSVIPKLITEPEIELPAIKGNSFPTGKLILKIAISPFGLVDWVESEQSTLPPLYEKIIENAFRLVQYQAGEKDEKPVATLITIEVSIDKEGSPINARLLDEKKEGEPTLPNPNSEH